MHGVRLFGLRCDVGMDVEIDVGSDCGICVESAVYFVQVAIQFARWYVRSVSVHLFVCEMCGIVLFVYVRMHASLCGVLLGRCNSGRRAATTSKK